MDKEPQVIAWFQDVTQKDIPLVGGKGANLGEMTRTGIPVPPGFVVTAEAYHYFLERSRLRGKIGRLLKKADPNDSAELQDVSNQIKGLIIQAPMPATIAKKIEEAYHLLGNGLVAVRSSATAEDLPEASFAGQQRTYLNVEGDKNVVSSVQACWASLFEPRAIFYRHQQGLDHLKIGIAVPVQRMIQSEVSGVMFTAEPVSNDPSKILIEAVYGLGEAIVSGEVTPDLYVVDREKMEIVDKKLGKQEWQLVRNPLSWGWQPEPNLKVLIFPPHQLRQKLSDEDILELARMGIEIERHYDYPQDIEWAKERGQIYIVQTRPVTTIKPLRLAEEAPELEGTLLLSGVAASPGLAAGPVKIARKAAEIDKVMAGDILVAEMTTPDFVPAMKRAVAIVTDKGGRTAHAAIVSRELGIPCVVGTERATESLEDGQVVTVDGFRGKVYQDRIIPEEAIAVPEVIVSDRRIRTRTKVYVNLAEPELAETVAQRDVDGVGLLRAEFIIAHIGEHPRHMLKENRGQQFIDKLAQGLTIFAKAFHPRPVVYRTTDFKTNEYRNLKGGEEFEELEENPMLGYRGCSRYIQERDAFRLEIEAIKKVREQYENLWVMIPFVRTPEELATTKQILEEEGLRQTPKFKLWMMVEVPSNILLIDEFLDVGIDGISIGSNDLTQLILGLDRDNQKLAGEFDERNEAVLMALERAVRTSSQRGVTSSICGQAPSVYPELTEQLVRWGITSVSVSPDMIDKTRLVVYEAEQRTATPSRLRQMVRSMSWAERGSRT
ncbi:MAG TPA: phosphoenolpyruvate synthase [Dehalococcoidia bacterium]|nr:phosphoenolpyruvate synthase [Dehalococcoidia bacterium]